MPSSLFLSFPFCTLVLCLSPCSLTSWPYLFSLSSLIPCRYLQFTLRLGSRSILSSCPAPDQPGEGVLLHYSSDNGITWTLLQHYAYQGFHEPRYFLYLNLLFSHECVSLCANGFSDSINTRMCCQFCAGGVCCWDPLRQLVASLCVMKSGQGGLGFSCVQLMSHSSSSPLERSTEDSDSATT